MTPPSADIPPPSRPLVPPHTDTVPAAEAEADDDDEPSLLSPARTHTLLPPATDAPTPRHNEPALDAHDAPVDTLTSPVLPNADAPDVTHTTPVFDDEEEHEDAAEEHTHTLPEEPTPVSAFEPLRMVTSPPAPPELRPPTSSTEPPACTSSLVLSPPVKLNMPPEIPEAPLNLAAPPQPDEAHPARISTAPPISMPAPAETRTRPPASLPDTTLPATNAK